MGTYLYDELQIPHIRTLRRDQLEDGLAAIASVLSSAMKKKRTEQHKVLPTSCLRRSRSGRPSNADLSTRLAQDCKP